MSNLKDYLLDNLKSALAFCKAMDKAKSEEDLEKMVTGYAFSLVIANMLVEKRFKLKSKEEIEKFYQELEEAINEEDSSEVTDFIKFSGSTKPMA